MGGGFDVWIVFLKNLSAPVFLVQKEMKRWPASQRFRRQESFVWMDQSGRNLSPLPAAAV